AIHPADFDFAAFGQADPLVAVELEVADAIKLRVVRHTSRAIAEADLGAQIDADLRAAIGRAATERLAQTPLVERERPLHLVPHRTQRAHGRGVAGKQARKPGAERNDQERGAQPHHTGASEISRRRSIRSSRFSWRTRIA